MKKDITLSLKHANQISPKIVAMKKYWFGYVVICVFMTTQPFITLSSKTIKSG